MHSHEHRGNEQKEGYSQYMIAKVSKNITTYYLGVMKRNRQ